MPAIDKIVVAENGTSKTMTVDQWKSLPIPDRVRLIGGAATFFAGAAQVPAKEAIAQLR